MEQLDHGNVIRMLDVFSDERYVYTVSSLNCDLQRHIKLTVDVFDP